MSPAERLAVEHLTAPSASPLRIVELSASLERRAATVLVSPFAAFPQTAGIDLVGRPAERLAVRRAAIREGVALALAYPFVLSGRTGADALRPGLEAAADIGAQGVGLLVYDRDLQRAQDETAAICAQAAALGLGVALEFYGGSAVRTLAQADAFAQHVAAAGLSLCVDLLHLDRSGGVVADLRGLRTPVSHGQISDAPRPARLERDFEAAYGRLAPGLGDLDVAGFCAALPPDAWIGVEVPPHDLAAEDEISRLCEIHRSTHGRLSSGRISETPRGPEMS